MKHGRIGKEAAIKRRPKSIYEKACGQDCRRFPKLSDKSPEKDVVWIKQSQSTLKEKVKILKELDEKIIDALSESKEENADDLMAKEIEETDEVIAELERILIQMDDALSKIGEQSVHSTPTNLAEISGRLTTAKYRLTPKTLVKS